MAVPAHEKAQLQTFTPKKVYQPAPSNIAKPNAAMHTLQKAVSLGGLVKHASHPPLDAQHNLLGSLPAPVKGEVQRTLGGKK